MKRDIKGELAVAISDNRKKVRFKAGTELPDKVNLVVVDVEEVLERDGSKFVVHVEFTSTPLSNHASTTSTPLSGRNSGSSTGSVTDTSTGSVTEDNNSK